MAPSQILPDYVMADISGAAAVPCGRRGYIVIREGSKYAHLLCPRSFKVFRLELELWDSIEFSRADYDPRAVAARLIADRDMRRRNGMRDGGQMVERAIRWLQDT